MKPDRLAEIEAQYKAGYYTDASIIAQLIEAAHELRTELTTARQTIVNLLGENRALRQAQDATLRAELRQATAHEDDISYGLRMAGEVDDG